MAKYWDKKIKSDWIKDRITNEAIKFAEEFGTHLAKPDEDAMDSKGAPKFKGKWKVTRNIMTTNQLRKFFGEVKKQQISGYDPENFILLKPKLAYAVGKARDEDGKIHDFYFVMSNAIDQVSNEKEFKTFIKIFESIVAYHRAMEESNLETI